ncbi:unnamed protein product [Microthlaspi erraticum]|uniref:Uncharacterized protein n=1 Tax=Microthlaspi erraticum TaxID=1685480 RepID=A0A6D2K8D5_9BRAS|nr:unnamed protein product [Microthlaspi erraticum]
MWCVVPIGYNSSYPLSWVLLSDWSALDPIRFCISPLASHPLLKLILSLSSWVSLPDSIRSSLSSPSSWCHHLVGLEQDCSKCTFPRPEGFVRFPVWRVSSPSCLRIKISYFNPSLISMFLSFHIVAWKCAEYLHPNIYVSCSCGIDLGRPSHLSICSSDLHSASTKLLRMVSYVVQTLLFLIWRTLIFRPSALPMFVQ